MSRRPSFAFVGDDRIPPEALQLVDRRLVCDRADDVRRTGLFLGPAVRSDDLVQPDQVDGPAAREEGVTRLKSVLGPIRAPAPKGA